MSAPDTSDLRTPGFLLNARQLILIFAIALAARAGWGVVHFSRTADPTTLEFPDEMDYWTLAGSLARGEGLVGEHGFRALRMPLYPGFLSLFARFDRGVVMAKIAQWPIGALAAVLIAMLGARVGGRAVGLLAGLFVACDPFLVFFSSLLLMETAFITVLCGLWLAGWGLLDRTAPASAVRWLPIALLAALCVYVRESSLVLVTVWTAFLVIRRRFERSAVTGGVLVLVVVVVSLLPWAVRNERVTDHFCWLTHRGGISLYDGVGPQATGAGNLGAIKMTEAVRDLDEAAWNRYFWDKSLESIRSDPLRILGLAGVKMARMWNPVPNVDTYQSGFIRFISAAWMLPLYALAVFGAVRLYRRNRGAVVALLLPAVCLLALHAVFVGSVRYRLGAMPMVEVLAAFGCVALLTRRRGSADSAVGSPPGP